MHAIETWQGQQTNQGEVLHSIQKYNKHIQIKIVFNFFFMSAIP